MKKFYLFLLCLGLALSNVTYANTITFDDLAATGIGTVYTAVPDSYQGFNWNNFNVIDTTSLPPTGFGNVTISGPNVAYNGGGGNPSSFSSATPFILDSGYFASAYRDGMTFEVRGLDGTATVFDETFILNVTASSFLAFPDLPVTEVDFITSGGVPDRNYVAGPAVVALDNLTISQIPDASSTVLLLAASVGGLALLRKRFS